MKLNVSRQYELDTYSVVGVRSTGRSHRWQTF